MSPSKDRKSSFKLRAVVSLMTAWMFLVAGLTGLVMFIVPQGRIAYWNDWRLIGLSKDHFGNLHIVSSVLFLIFGIWHVVYNWKPLLSYMRRKAAQARKVRGELWATAAATAVLTASALAGWPPVDSLPALSDHIKAAWIQSPEDEPPFGHAELLSVQSLSRKMRVDADAAVAAIRRAGYAVEGKDRTLEEIASRNGVAPSDVFDAFSHLAERAQVTDMKPSSAENGERERQVFGLGRKTVAAACEGAEARTRACIRRLHERDIEARPDELMREVALRHGMVPEELLRVMVGADGE